MMQANGMPVGFTPIPLGQFAKPIGIERLKLNEGESQICSVLSMEVLPAYVHYDPEIRMLFYCFKGSCCQQAGSKQQLRYVLPILCYSGTRQQYGPPYTLKYISLGNQVYERLCKKMESSVNIFHQTIDKCDIEIICESGEYQMFNFELLAKDAYYRMNEPNMGNDLNAAYMQDWYSLAYTSIAKPMTEEVYQELKQQARERLSLGDNGYNRGGYGAPRYGTTPMQRPAMPYGQQRQNPPVQSYGGVQQHNVYHQQPVAQIPYKQVSVGTTPIQPQQQQYAQTQAQAHPYGTAQVQQVQPMGAGGVGVNMNPVQGQMPVQGQPFEGAQQPLQAQAQPVQVQPAQVQPQAQPVQGETLDDSVDVGSLVDPAPLTDSEFESMLN